MKQEFIISSLGPNQLYILHTIVNFYLFAMLDSKCDYHKCHSEVYSTMCCAVQLHKTYHKDFSTIDENMFVYYVFLNLQDSVLVANLLKQNDTTKYPFSLCFEVYICYKSCNYHRFWKIWDSLDCLKQAALSRHAKSLGQNAERVIVGAYKSKNLRYPEYKFLHYTCMPATGKYFVDNKGVNLSEQTADDIKLDELQRLTYNVTHMPNLDSITDNQKWVMRRGRQMLI